MDTSLKWYALYTRPRWEKKIAERLCQKDIENYCPLHKVQRQWSDRKKIVLEPLFTCYLFVRITDTRQLYAQKVEGVLGFVHWLGRPAVIRDQEIDTIKCFMNDHTCIRLEKSAVDLHKTVRIPDGPFMAQEGQVLEVRNKTAKILLPSLGIVLVGLVPETTAQI